ncbi:MAG: hypothetical protein H6828_07140 [Planctomycetes bacterium]|nr:hypothetical protein [Planctomycetota bacterium]
MRTTTTSAPPEWLEWTPALGKRSVSASFKSRELARDERGRYVLRATVGDRLFSGLFVTLGVGGLVAGGLMTRQEEGGLGGLLLAVLVGGVFLGVGVYMWRHGNRRVIFDGLGNEVREEGRGEPRVLARYADVVGLQLLRKTVESDEGDWTSVELNLVTRDRRRHSLADHASRTALRRDAGQLADHLGVPLWDRSA